jgi:hypothetical protein
MKPRFISKKVFKVAKSKRLLTANKPLKNIKFIKIFTSLFAFKRKSQKTKKLIFLPIFGSHTNKWILWPELSLRLTSTHPIQ